MGDDSWKSAGVYVIYLFVAIERPDVGCAESVRGVATAAYDLCAEQLTLPRTITARAPLPAHSALCTLHPAK